MKKIIVSFLLLLSTVSQAAPNLHYVGGISAYPKGELTDVAIKTNEDGSTAAILLTVMFSASKYNQCVISGQNIVQALDLAKMLQSNLISDIHCYVSDATDARNATLVGSKKYTIKMRMQ